jgi:hypothetical protein
MDNKYSIVPAVISQTKLSPLVEAMSMQVASARSKNILEPQWLPGVDSLRFLRDWRSSLPVESTSSFARQVMKDTTIGERLFDATATVKVMTSQIAMHIDSNWRDKLFSQLDSLHDPDEWMSEDIPIRRESFSTFLKTILQLRPNRRPGLGLSHIGHLIASWAIDHDYMTLEFLPDDRVRWIVSRHVDGELERIAGQSPVAILKSTLALFQPEKWFSYAIKGNETS